MTPGEYLLDESAGPIPANVGRRTERLLVRNTGDRPVQLGSHFHFFEANRSLAFDRARAYGLRLNIPAGTAVRFEPGESKEVELTEFGGQRVIYGFNSLVSGPLSDSRGQLGDLRVQERAIGLARKRGFLFADGAPPPPEPAQ